MADKTQPTPAPIAGIAHGVQQRTEQGGQGMSETIWTFRLDRFDEQGNALPPVPVEMRAGSFEGFINEGDKVELTLDASRKWKPGRLARVRRVRDVTTGATLKAKGIEIPSIVGWIILGIFALVFLAFGVLFAAAPAWVPAEMRIIGILIAIAPSVFLIGTALRKAWQAAQGNG